MGILKMLYCVAEADNPHTSLTLKQLCERIFIGQQQVAQPVAVAGKFKWDLR